MRYGFFFSVSSLRFPNVKHRCTHTEGEREAKKRKKPRKSCRRRVGNGGDLGGKRNKRRQERVGPVAANPGNVENNKETGGEGARGT